MPRYSCKAALREKLSYAIHFCKSIDNGNTCWDCVFGKNFKNDFRSELSCLDEYARVAAPSEILLNPPGAAMGAEDDEVES